MNCDLQLASAAALLIISSFFFKDKEKFEREGHLLG